METSAENILWQERWKTTEESLQLVEDALKLDENIEIIGFINDDTKTHFFGYDGVYSESIDEGRQDGALKKELVLKFKSHITFYYITNGKDTNICLRASNNDGYIYKMDTLSWNKDSVSRAIDAHKTNNSAQLTSAMADGLSEKPDAIRKIRCNIIQAYRDNQRSGRYKVPEAFVKQCEASQVRIETLILKRANSEFDAVLSKLGKYSNTKQKAVNTAVHNLLTKIAAIKNSNPESTYQLFEVLESLDALLNNGNNNTWSALDNFFKTAKHVSGAKNQELCQLADDIADTGMVILGATFVCFMLAIVIAACTQAPISAYVVILLLAAASATIGASVFGAGAVTFFAAQPTGLSKAMLDVHGAANDAGKLHDATPSTLSFS